MIVRWSVLSLAAVAVIVGVTGLLAPVHAGPRHIGCGTAVATDLSTARAATATPGPGVPWPTTLWEEPDITEPFHGRVHVDYLTLCRQELNDRRLWTISLAAVGVVAAAAAAAAIGLAHRRSARREARS